MNNILKILILLFIQFLEKIEYRNLSLDQDDVNKKILNTLELLNVEVETDSGWQPASHIHITQPFNIWKIKTEKGKYLECADKHKVFTNQFQEIFVKDLKVGSYIQTENGIDRVVYINKSNTKVSMFDITVDHPDHRYYTNGILSHNCVGFNTLIDVIYFKDNKKISKKMYMGELYYESLEKIRHLKTLEKIKRYIWRIIAKIDENTK